MGSDPGNDMCNFVHLNVSYKNFSGRMCFKKSGLWHHVCISFHLILKKPVHN